MAAIESAELAIGTAGFEDGPANGCISQLLREPQVFGLADGAELVPVLLVVLVELRLAAEAGAGGIEQQPEEMCIRDRQSAMRPSPWFERSLCRSGKALPRRSQRWAP